DHNNFIFHVGLSITSIPYFKVVKLPTKRIKRLLDPAKIAVKRLSFCLISHAHSILLKQKVNGRCIISGYSSVQGAILPLLDFYTLMKSSVLYHLLLYNILINITF